jgi:glycosyltransferase involved in cell wall biosynthesis
MVIAIIPAYNEEKTITKVVSDVGQYVDEIVVVNDGSNDRTAELAERAGAKVINHLFNRGLGASLSTGMTIALKETCPERSERIIITFDADGQHQAADIPKIIDPILTGETDAVIGSRMLNPRGMPLVRRIYNWLANLATFILFGIWTTDSQSGLRAFSYAAASRIRIRTDGMEVSSEIIGEIKRHKLRLKEIPIQAIYTKYSLSKGQNLLLGIKTFFRLLFHKVIE